MSVIALRELRRRVEPGWSLSLAALTLAWAAVLILYARDVAHLVSIWWNSSTFNHCLLIVPIIIWLVGQRIDALRMCRPTPFPPGLLLVAAGAMAWTLGEAAAFASARHAGLVLMLQGAAIFCLGWPASRLLAFPIFYALFLVPVGEELVPAMQLLTARLTVSLLTLSGLPAHLDGIFITTPFGRFEVAEACAGVKFLIAMLALAALAAHLCFRSWRRRVAFLIVALLLPILANVARAWGTIVMARQVGLDFAAGMDHVIYGGIFFALVTVFLLGAASPWFDRRSDEGVAPRPAEILRGAGPSSLPPAILYALALLLIALPQLSIILLDARSPGAVDPTFRLPPVSGWRQEPPQADWAPEQPGADLRRIATYHDARGRTVDLVLTAFETQEEGRELVGSGAGAAAGGNGWTWVDRVRTRAGTPVDRIASDGRVREVATFYLVGDRLVGSALEVKLETMRVRMTGSTRRAVAIHLSSPNPGDGAIDDFLADLGALEALALRAVPGS